MFFHPSMVLWCFMFSYFKSAIDNIVKPASFFVIDEKRFTRDSKFSFKDYVTFFCVNKGTSNQADLEDFIEDDFTNNLETITRQALSKQRVFINPLVFKEISKEYQIVYLVCHESRI